MFDAVADPTFRTVRLNAALAAVIWVEELRRSWRPRSTK
jgi:hypothetical protein